MPSLDTAMVMLSELKYSKGVEMYSYECNGVVRFSNVTNRYGVAWQRIVVLRRAMV